MEIDRGTKVSIDICYLNVGKQREIHCNRTLFTRV